MAFEFLVKNSGLRKMLSCHVSSRLMTQNSSGLIYYLFYYFIFHSQTCHVKPTSLSPHDSLSLSVNFRSFQCDHFNPRSDLIEISRIRNKVLISLGATADFERPTSIKVRNLPEKKCRILKKKSAGVEITWKLVRRSSPDPDRVLEMSIKRPDVTRI